MLQSLLKEADLKATLAAVAAVLRPGAVFGVDLVADLPSWKEYRREQRLSGWRPGHKAHVTLIESVRQDRERGLTILRAGIRRAARPGEGVAAVRPRVPDA